MEHSAASTDAQWLPSRHHFETRNNSAFLNAPNVSHDVEWKEIRRVWFRRSRRLAGIFALLISFGILFAIGTGKLSFFRVPSSSMEPTLLPDDRMVVYPSAEYRRGEIIVAKAPDDPDEFIVKRLVGLPGDELRVSQGRLYVNGTPIHEAYLTRAMDYEMAAVTVSEGRLFLLGDNRNRSDDSHLWQAGIPLDQVVGKVRYIYGPASRRHTVEHETGAFARIP